MALVALSPGQYGDLAQEIADLIDQDLGTVHRKIALDLFTGVVKKTPVDTGRARASWKVGTGSIDGTVAPKGSGPPESAIVAEGEAKIAAIRKPVLTFITNSLPYASALENGHSRQAPAGIVAVTAAEVRNDLGRLLG